MPASRKSKDSSNAGLLHENVLEAVVVADSFCSRFTPITDARSKSLLPIANQPLLSYTLEFLASCGVKHIYVYCCHCAEQVKAFLSTSKWSNLSSPCTVTAVISSGLSSIGDVFRDIDQKSLLESDFIFIPGDIVSNVQLKDALEEHKARREKDKTKPLMTLMMQNLSPTHHARSAENDVIVACDKATNRVLHYQKLESSLKTVNFPLNIFNSKDSVVELCYDLLDTGIWICSPQVPQLFTDNFDYQTQLDFIKGILINEEFLGNQIHMHVIKHRYCARVHNLYMYDSVSHDVLSRWAYPFVPELMFDTSAITDGDRYKLQRHNVYLHPTCVLGVNSKVDNNSIIGAGTIVGTNCQLSNCVIGNGCTIEDGCKLQGTYVWNNVVIKRGCSIYKSIVCDDVKMHENVVLEKGCILCDKVCVGPSIKLATDTVVYLPSMDDFEDEIQENEKPPTDIVGTNGKGFVWKEDEESDDEDDDRIVHKLWGLSLRDHLEVVARNNEEDAYSNTSSFAFSDEEANEIESEEEIPLDDEFSNFQREVKESLLGGYNEKSKCDNLILEVNASKYAYNMPLKDIVQTVTKSLFEIAATDTEAASYYLALRKVLEFFLPVLCNYNKTITAQLDCLYAIEEHAASHENVAACLVKVFMFLYDNDVVTEEAFMVWNSKPAVSYFALLSPQEIRTKVSKFIQWLQEAEEEDSDD